MLVDVRDVEVWCCEVESKWPSRVALLEGAAMTEPDGLELQDEVFVVEKSILTSSLLSAGHFNGSEGCLWGCGGCRCC
mgnify:CR=1 FL=1